MEEERLITGPEAGITRDSIALDWLWRSPGGEQRAGPADRHGRDAQEGQVQDKLEKLAVADGLRAVDFAEVVVLLLDGTLGLEGAGPEDRGPGLQRAGR